MRPHRRIRSFLLAGLLTLCGAMPSLSQLVLGAGGGVSFCEGLGGDTDGDTLCDDEDPCKSFANTLPLVISNIYGIPDECLCGDFDGNGSLSATDAAAINRCAAFVSDACLPRRDEVAPPFNGFFSATDASLVNRVAAFVDPAYTLTCELRPEGTCGELTGVPCRPSGGECDVDYFPNGVAAGDVDQSSVVLWARAESAGTVRFEWGRDPNFSGAPDGIRDVVVPDPADPAKVDDIFGLLSGTQYYYRACRGDTCPSASATGCEARGSFRTPYADGLHGLHFGVSSCWRGDMKPFVSIKNVPGLDLDFFVALGDTVYADSPESGGRVLGGLGAFRDQHKLAYSQEDSNNNWFASARASTASYVTIDDHEVVNDFAGGAPPRSQEGSCECDGTDLTDVARNNFCKFPWGICFCNSDDDPNGNCDRDYINETDLFIAALQAWHEYNPVREERYGETGDPDDTGDPRTAGKPKLYRHRTFGKDAALFMLDARSFRDEEDLLSKRDPNRTMLGKAQLDELLSDLRNAEDNGITWKFILVPEPMQNLDPVTGKDRFEGYAHERDQILDVIETECIANVVFISGDIHATIVNNLTYRKSPLFLQRFSSSWDISTGAAAYHLGIGPTFTRSDPSGIHEFYDSLFQFEMNRLLGFLDRPATGLGLEVFRLPPLQQWNRSVPATLLQGSYVAAHTYGWTEFEIDPATQKLLVTTYGVDWYKPGAEVAGREPFVVSQFEVATSCGCQKLVCLNDGDCCENTVCNLLGGDQGELLPTCVRRNSLENGELCSREDACQSGICVLGICGGCQPIGDVCGEIEDCCSDHVCSTLLCVPPNSLQALVPCTTDDACRSGNCVGVCQQVCGDGFCDGTEKCGGNDVTALQCRTDCGQCPNGSLCGDDNMCESSLCNGGICTFPQENGSACVRDDGCESGLCNAGICTAPQANGSLCVRHEGCQSGLCDLGFCTAPNSRPALSPCFSGDACRSGSCTLGTCAQICGDGFCDGTEKCGVLRPLSCTADCSLCPADTTCVGDVDCSDGACNFLSCTAPLGNGSLCSRPSACQSGRCFSGVCVPANCQLPSQVCTSDGQCCTGECRSIPLLADRCL